MVKYYCNYCRYKFENKKAGTPKICPFCSKAGTLTQDLDAASLLKDVDSMQ